MSVDWGERYRLGDTPWEKGRAHPALKTLLSEHRDLFSAGMEVLVPGCGLGHDARLIAAETGARVTGLDVAPEALEQAVLLTSPGGPEWQWGDLFTWEGQYQLVFEHTCFCAIPPARRPEYVEAMARLIPPGGWLLGIFFLNPDHDKDEGPPFGVELAELEDFFRNDFEIQWSQPPSETYEGREGEGREVCLLMQRRSG